MARNGANGEWVDDWDEAKARSIIGKTVLIGLLVQDDDDEIVESHQLHGRIVSANRHEGIEVALEGLFADEVWTMPPVLEALEAAEPGTYTLEATGETVESPDFIATWVVAVSDEDDDEEDGEDAGD